jgi:type I restriction enzyme S subunit
MELKPGYKQTEVGVIPEEWEVVTASEACSLVVDCKNRTPPIVDASEYAVVRTPNVRDGQFIQEDLRFTDESSYREWTARAVPQAGDIMITREAPLGEVCAVPETHKVCLGQRMMLYRPSPSKTDSRYLLYSLMSLPVRANLMRKIGGSTVGHAKVDDIRFLKLPLPPLSEQRTIAMLLSDTDALLASLKQLIAKKRNIKQAAMQELLTGKRRLPGFEGDWEVKRLGDVANLNRNNIVPALYPSKPFAHFSLPAFDTGKTAPVELGISIGSNKFTIPASAVLVSKLNPRIPRAWAPEIVPPNAVASTEWLILTPKDEIDRNYLFTLCSSPAFCQQMELAATGTTGSHQRISPSIALDIKIMVTPLRDEQASISSILSDMDSELLVLSDRLQKARELKQGMMQQLLTGKIRLT